MPRFDPDPSRIQPNPFAFKADPDEAAAVLKRELDAVAQFFVEEAGAPGEVEAAWQRYQDLHGAAGVLRLASSIDHVLELQRDLEAIDACEGGHELRRLGGLQILLHLGLIEIVEGGGHVSQLDWALKKLKDGALARLACSFPWYAPWRRAVRTRDIRQLLTELKNGFNADRGTAHTLVRALSEGLSQADKQTLLHGWILSEEYPLGSAHDLSTWKHLYCRWRLERWNAATPAERRTVLPYPNRDRCSRLCHPATAEEVREVFPVLVRQHLYRMRNEVVHAASPVIIAGTPNKEVLAWASAGEIPTHNLGSSTIDGYFVGDGKMITYEAILQVTEVNAVLRRCLWNRLRGIAP